MAKIEIHSPIDGRLVGEVPAMSRIDIDKAVSEVAEAQSDWAALPLEKRAAEVSKLAAVLRGNEKFLADSLVYEIGKTLPEAADEVIRTAQLIEAMVAEAKQIEPLVLKSEDFRGWKPGNIQQVTKVPWGVVLAISPYNYPINLSLSKIAPALIMGNTVVFKPSTYGSVTATKMMELFDKAAMPKGILKVVTGQGGKVGDYLINHPYINMISMTGSTEVGQKIAQQSGMLPLMLELGGNDPAIVLADADLELAAKNIVHGAFKYAGQRCTAVKRVYVVESVADQLVEKIVAYTKKEFGSAGNPRKHPLGPVLTDEHADYVEGLLKDAIKRGGEVLIGGKRDGRVIEATVVDDVSHESDLVKKEQFGPVLPIVRVKDVEEAVTKANDTKYGLQASVFSVNRKVADEIADQLQVGGVHVNGPDQRGPDNFLFVGHKDSGLGSQGIKFSLMGMAQDKGVVHNKTD